MKAVAILGSPRKQANSHKLVSEALAALPQKDLVAAKYVLNDLNIKGCQGCFACKGKSDTCVVKDDLAPVLAGVAEADFVILASPIYIGEVTAQTKAFIDRTFAYFKPDYMTSSTPGRLQPGKKMLFILTQGMPDRSAYAGPVLGHYGNYFQRQGFDFQTFIAPGQGLDDILSKSPALVDELKQTVKSMC